MSHRLVRLCFAALAPALVLSGCGGDDGGGEGEVHALGETVTAGWAETTDTGERGAETSIDVTPIEVRQGTQDDLTEGGLEVDPEDEDTIPYYVDVRYENVGDGTITRSLDVNLEDVDGNLINGTIIFNFGDIVFEPCPNITEGRFKPGDTYESCTLFLVDPGIEIDTISFLSDQGEGVPQEFVYWEID